MGLNIARKLTKVIHVFNNGEVEVYSVCDENLEQSVIRDTDMAEEML